MKDILDQIYKELSTYNDKVQQRLKFMLNRYSVANWDELPTNEKATNRVDIYRSLDSNDCGFACFVINDQTQEIDQVEDELGAEEVSIFENWEAIWDLDKTCAAVEEHGDIFEIELEIIYVRWFVENFNAARKGRDSRIQYCLTENNSQRSFDLNLFNWDEYLDIYNYGSYKITEPRVIPSESGLRNRILLGFLGDEIEELTRKLIKDNHAVEFIYQDSSLIIKDNNNVISFEQNFKDSADQFSDRNDVLRKMVKEIDLLEANGYLESEE